MSTTKKSSAKVNPLFQGLSIANEEYTISSIFNKLSKKTCANDNFILSGWHHIQKAIKEDTKNDIKSLILHNKKGYVILTNHFAREFWNKDRKTAVEGKTWNLFENVVTNKGKCSVYFVYLLLMKLSKMDTNEFNSIYNRGIKTLPATKSNIEKVAKKVAAKKVSEKNTATV